jgi:pimeloyl-ACP methyl ester carboxylesterase
MRKSAGQIIGRWAGIGASAALAGVGIVALRHALETPQAQKSVLPGEAHLYRWQRRSIFYKVLGDHDAPPLVLLHRPEIGASSHEMLPLMEPLARTYRVYALDWLGFGLSDRPGIAYSAEVYNRLCQDFLCEVVQAPATVMASGLSCNYAVVAAAREPACCASLVFISPIALQGRLPASPLKQIAEKAPVKALLYPLLSTHLAFQVTRQMRGEPGEDFAQFYANTHQLGAEHAAMAALAGKLLENVEPAFEKLRQPILMIWGTHALDNPQTVASLHKTVTLANPARQARKVELIQRAALAAHVEQPENVITAIQRWQEETQSDQLAHEPLTRQITEQSAQRAAEEAVPETTTSSSARQPGEPIAITQPEQQENEERNASLARSETPATSSASEISIAASASDTAQVSEQAKEQETEPSITAYCVKCKQQRPMLNARQIVMKNGRAAMRGICGTCGTRMNRIISASSNGSLYADNQTASALDNER